jgi:PleD family two-component response regulator
VEKDHSQGLAVTISLGLTEYIAGESAQTFLKRVDKALYEAKQAGRNRLVIKPGQQDFGA